MEEIEEPIEKNNSDCHLELGDVIQLNAPNNLEFQDKLFYINYIDDTKIKLVNVQTYEESLLKLDNDGNIKDESITNVTLLGRSDDQGYAKQHSLLPNTWIDIHIGGEVPIIITGQISNLEEDMIEITTYPNLDVIYIDFAFKGLPEDIPIEKIVIRPKPPSLEKIDSLVNVKEQLPADEDFDVTKLEEEEASMEFQPSGEMVIQLPENIQKDDTLREEMQKKYHSADEIVYGEDLDDLVQQIEIPEEQKRFSLETQVNDMLDVLLSQVAFQDRRNKTNEIHLLIERFRELRNKYSLFDDNGNLYNSKSNGRSHKPLSNHMYELDHPLKWVVPLTSIKKKVYPYSERNMFEDVLEFKNDAMISSEVSAQEQYLKNQNQNNNESAYVQYYQNINDNYIPFVEPNDPQQFLIYEKEISAPMETMISNLDNFHSTVIRDAEKQNDQYARTQYVIQKYNLTSSYLEPKVAKTGKKIFVRTPLTKNETMSIQSFMMLPKPVMEFSTLNLPGSSILSKCHYGQHYFHLFQYFHRKTPIESHIIDDFNKEMDKDIWENIVKNNTFNTSVQHFLLDDSLEQNPERFQKYVQSIVPDSENIVRLLEIMYEKKEMFHGLNVRNIVNQLEPFLVYLQDVNYSQLNAIRFSMKENRKQLLLHLDESKTEFNKVKTQTYAKSIPFPHKLEKLLEEKKDLLSILLENYSLTENKSSENTPYVSDYEWLSKMISSDDGVLFCNMVRLLMSSLVSPENLMEALQNNVNEEDDMSNVEKIKANDCITRVLTKKYMSLKDLQKDNSNEDLFYDKEFDNSPYDLINTYKDQKKKYSAENFLEFLEEILVEKHEYPPKLANELAQTLVDGKKKVKEGEYAILEILPHLKENKDITDFSPKEKEELVDEASVLKKKAYYKRINNYWVHDESVGEEAFMDNNTMFCNMSKLCFKNTKTDSCEPTKLSEMRLKNIEKNKILKEFDKRFAESVDNLEETLKELVASSLKHLKHLKRLEEVHIHKANNLAFEMGKYIKEVTSVVSPNQTQLDNILGQDDFIKKQQDIVDFAEQFCRDPMVAELGDSPYYLYCVETNVPLLPTSLFELARAFVSNEDYNSKLSELIRKQGVIEDDVIYDKYSGKILQKLDSVDEDQYDEQGFKLVSNEVIEKDALDVTVTAFEKRKKLQDKVFDNEETEMIFLIFRSITSHIGIQGEPLEEFVMRISNELISNSNLIKGERTYKIEAKELEEKKKKKMPPYELYRNKLIILIVSSVILVAIQTSVPPFKVQKTFPGCIQSFKGYPDNQGSVEDTSGMEYLGCVLGKLKNKGGKPWNSIKPLPVDVINSQLKKVIQESILPRNDLMELYIKKNEYMILHPDLDIPKEHDLEKWKHFLPPLVDYEIVKTLKGLPSDYVTELEEMQKTGNKKQREQLSMYKSKIIQFTYAIVEQVNDVVKSKGLLLKTASNTYFTENACCNDKKTNTTLNYFENNAKEISVYVNMVKKWEEIIKQTTKRAVAAILFHPKRTGLQFENIELSNEHFEKNVYLAFMYYCNLNNQFPIPPEFRVLFPEKLEDYDPKASLMDKIDFLKQNGKKFNNNNLLQLMDIVNKNNIVDVSTNNDQKGNVIHPILDLFQYIHNKPNNDDDIPLCGKFRELITNVLHNYSPRKMVAEDSEDTYKLNNWLTRANSNLLERIVDFLSKHAKLPKRKMEKLEEQMANIHIWNMDKTYEQNKEISPSEETTMYSVIQFMKTSIFAMSKTYPEVIINNHDHSNKVHKHWKFADLHALDISNFISKYYGVLGPFKNDSSLQTLLFEIQKNLGDLVTFVQYLPAFLPIHSKTEEGLSLDYYSLFSKRTLFMIYSYVYYSVIYEYIKVCNSDEMVYIDLVTNQEIRRNNIAQERENAVFGYANEEKINEDQENYSNDLNEVQIRAGDQEKIRIRVAELLHVFITLDMKNKKTFDLSYGDIEKRIMRSKMNEKKMITDFLKNMDDDERRVEDTKKMLKLGRWNVGLKKGLVEYDKGTYVHERNQLFEQLTNQATGDGDDVVVQMNIQDLERQQQEDIEEQYEDEANNFHNYMGNDEDGAYYEEDRETDFNED